MSAVMDKPRTRKAPVNAEREAWSAWSNGDEMTRVQINDHALARFFAKVSGARRTGYSVMGPFTEIYVTQHSQDWVKDWMKGHKQSAAKASSAPTSIKKA